MTDREYQKMRADARRGVSRKYGFRQSSYINFKVEDGYFFCLYFLTDVRLTVKPMYADDLWWDIWESTENKNEPLSLRGTGAYSLSGQILATYEIKDTTDRSELESLFEQVFHNATAEIKKFIADNPDADHFYPDESKMDHDPDKLLYLMALIHNGREEDVLAIIKDARKNKHRCMFRSGWYSDSYTYIKRWCNHNNKNHKFVFSLNHTAGKIVRLYAFMIMSMSRDRREDLPNHNCYSPLQGGILTASVLPFIVSGSYIGALIVFLLVSVSLWRFFNNRKTRYYYSEFLKLPQKVQKKWTIVSWTATTILWIYFIILIAYF